MLRGACGWRRVARVAPAHAIFTFELVEGVPDELAFDETALEFVFVGFALELGLLELEFITIEFVFITIELPFAVIVFCDPVEFMLSVLPQLLCQKNASATMVTRARLFFI